MASTKIAKKRVSANITYKKSHSMRLYRLFAAWLAVLVFAFGWPTLSSSSLTIISAAVVFTILFSVILYAAFGVVHESDGLAHMLGEPYGTIILTLSIVSIEVILISSVLLGPGETTSVGKDAIFSVMMIIMNLVTGLCLIVGAWRYKQQEYNKQGATIYLVLIAVLAFIGLGLPDFIGDNGIFTPMEATALGGATLLIYLGFLAMQIGPWHRLFTQPTKGHMVVEKDEAGSAIATSVNQQPNAVDWKAVAFSSCILIALMLPIVLLSHHMAVTIDFGIAALGAPIALSGVIIAVIVFTPESISSLKAALNNEYTRVNNLCLGAFLSTVGLTVPSVLFIGLIANKTVLLGMNRSEIILFIATMMLTAVTFTGRRTHMINGIAHLVLFSIYCLTLF